ncbi:MAG: hypothetical protein Q4F65_06850 [Propionibacteriaceae bacterium]|nr:hypothetical protein [Propionibacteriaceae bacterium]
MPTFLVVPLVLCAAVLLLSGVAKLRDTQATRDAFTALRLPAALGASVAPLLLPWAEIALGVLLLVARGWLLVLAAAATVALFLAYLVVIARALRFDEQVTCNCFGALGEQGVTSRTLVRNGVLVGTAVLAVVAAAMGASLPGALLADAPATLGVMAVSALAGAVTLFVLGHGPQAPAAGFTGSHVPPFTLLDAAGGGPVHSHGLFEERTLLLFASRGCGPCERVIAQWDDWRAASPGIRFRVVVNDASAALLEGWGSASVADGALLDPAANVLAALGGGTPTGLLVGPGGTLLAPVAVGTDALEALVREHGTWVPEDPAADHVEPASHAPAEPPAQDPAEEFDDAEAYVRTEIPDAMVLDEGVRPRTLRELTASTAALLVSINCLCGTSRDAAAAVERWRDLLPSLEVRLLSSMPAESLPEELRPEAAFAYDHAGLTQRALGLTGSPSAVLLGADGLLAGGPVTGMADIEEFVDAIAEQLAAAGAA